MDQALPIALNGLNMGAQHFDKVYDPLKAKYYKRKGYYQDDPDVQDHRTPEEKGYVLRRRRDVGSDEEIVETVRHRGEILPRRPGQPKEMARRASSYDDLRNQGKKAAAGGAAAGAMVPYRGGRDRNGDASDSEGSVPPRSRVRPKSTSGRSHTSRRRHGSSSSSESSSVCSSTEDERNVKKMKRKKWITAAFASVATIHAATKVYGSIEAHDKRVAQVATGEMSPEEAHKKQRATRWQDAAAIGIAALGIRGAISEWNEVSEEHAQHKELMEQKEMHHKKRLEHERRKRARERGGYYKGRDGEWYYDGPMPQSSQSKSSDNRAGRYDDRKAIRDSNRERRMLEYEEGGTEKAPTDYNYSEYKRDYKYDSDDDRRHRDKSRRRDHSRTHSRAHYRDDNDSYYGTRPRHRRSRDRSSQYYDEDEEEPRRRRRHRHRDSTERSRSRDDELYQKKKLERPQDTYGNFGVAAIGDILKV